MSLSQLADIAYEKLHHFSEKYFTVCIAGIFVAVLLYNGIGTVPDPTYQRLAQNPFITRTDISPDNNWQASLLLPLLAHYTRLTSPWGFNAFCLACLLIGFIILIIETKKKLNPLAALLCVTLLLAHPLTMILFSWIGTPDCLTFLVAVPLLFISSPVGIGILCFLGMLNHPVFIFAALELLVLRALVRDEKIKFPQLLGALLGLAAGYLALQLFLSHFHIHVFSKLDFILHRDIGIWLVVNLSYFPFTLFSFQNTFWFVLGACYLQFASQNRHFFRVLVMMLGLNYIVTFFTLDTTRIFTLLSWGISFYCLLHCFRLSTAERGSGEGKEFVRAMILLAFIGLLGPKFYSFEGRIVLPPSYKNLLRAFSGIS